MKYEVGQDRNEIFLLILLWLFCLLNLYFAPDDLKLYNKTKAASQTPMTSINLRLETSYFWQHHKTDSGVVTFGQ
jgi:hypothetical protein